MPGQPEEKTFTTTRLAFAAYLAASDSLHLLHIEPAGREARFVFKEERNRGAELEAEFFNGALVNAIRFHQQLRELRRLIDAPKDRKSRIETNEQRSHS